MSRHVLDDATARWLPDASLSIHMIVDVNAPVDRVWARVRKFCDIGQWGGFAGCTIVSGTDGEVGVVRSVAGEISPVVDARKGRSRLTELCPFLALC